jgi:beta-lactamase superfamily II metal-dependent hydrolase|tara:strand:- start:610 stop:1734 length:1125 start_codon:yes stop_codon:yes gene_type:complete
MPNRESSAHSGIFYVIFFTLLLGLPQATVQAQETLDMYLIDVEGGGATLFVSPAGETLLIDTGNGGQSAARDAGRIMDAMRDAGVDEIDHLITTHWHGDHYGAMQELASQVPVRHFIDHGSSVESNARVAEFLNTTYRALYEAAEHTVVTPGDRISLAGIEITVLASAKQVIDRPLPGGGEPNRYCADFVPQDEDNGENAQSVGILAQLAGFRVLHLGDLTVNTEFELMCPNNPIGTVDLFVVSHHGQPISNAEVLVHAIEARVAIMNNGTRKGGQPDAMQVLYSAPGLEDLWQLHFSQLSGQEYTVPGLFIANAVDEEQSAMPIAPLTGGRRGAGAPPRLVHNGEAHWIKVSGQGDGSFTVTNSRNGFTKEYR